MSRGARPGLRGIEIIVFGDVVIWGLKVLGSWGFRDRGFKSSGFGGSGAYVLGWRRSGSRVSI